MLEPTPNAAVDPFINQNCLESDTNPTMAQADKALTRNVGRGSIFALATVVIEVVVTYGRRGAHLVFEALHGAYDTHMERVRMRLMPIKQRNWREIARAEALVRRNASNTNAAQLSDRGTNHVNRKSQNAIEQARHR